MVAIVDETPFREDHWVAAELRAVLHALYPVRRQILALAAQAGLDRWDLDSELAGPLWSQVLRNGAGPSGALRRLVGNVIAVNDRDPRVAFLREVLDRDPDRIVDRPASGIGFRGVAALPSAEDIARTRGRKPEALLFQSDLTVEVHQLPRLAETLTRLFACAGAVCMVEVDVAGSGRGPSGTGFRIGTRHILTNHHVLFPAGGMPAAVRFYFGYERDAQGEPVTVPPVPGEVASIKASKEVDIALVEVRGELDPAWPILSLADVGTPAVGQPAFIVQHPNGVRKRIGFVRNDIAEVQSDGQYFSYLTDTQEGSSGAPVLDARGRLIGVHRAGGSPVKQADEAPVTKNEGIQIGRVIETLARWGISLALP